MSDDREMKPVVIYGRNHWFHPAKIHTNHFGAWAMTEVPADWNKKQITTFLILMGYLNVN